MGFDPDAFLAEEPKAAEHPAKGFDPDAFLAESSPGQPEVPGAGTQQPLPSSTGADDQSASPDQTPAPVVSPEASMSGGEENHSLPVTAEPSLAEQRSNLLKFRAKHAGMDPGRSADVLRISAITGQPPELVDANLDALKKQVEADEGIDWNQLGKQHPALSATLAADPHLQAAAKPDMEHFEKLSFAQQFKKNLKESFWPDDPVAANNRIMDGLRQQAERTSTPVGALLGYLKSTFSAGVLPAVNSPLFQAGRDAVAPFVAQAQGVATQELERELSNVTGLAESTLDIPSQTGKDPYGRALWKAATGSETPGMVGEYAARKLASGVWLGIPVFGEQAFNSMEPEDFKQSQDIIKGALGTWGAKGLDFVLGLIPMMGMGSLGAAEKGGAAALEEAGARGIGELEGTVGAVATKLTQWAGETLGAGFEGSLFGLSQAATEKGVDPDEAMLNNAIFAGILHNVFKAGGGGIREVFHGIFGESGVGNDDIAGVPGTSLTPESYQNRLDSTAANALLASRFDAASQAKLKDSSPEAFEHILESIGPGETISIPAEQWSTYFQGKRLNPLEWAAKVTEGDGKAFTDAAATGGDFTIPLSKALKHLAGTGHDAELIKDMRADPKLATPREIELQQKTIKEAMDAAEKERPGFDEEKKQVAEAMTQAAIGAKAPKAVANAFGKLMSEAYGSLALRTGVSVAEAARMGGLHELHLLGPEGQQALGGSLAQLARSMATPSATRYLTKRLASMPYEQRLERATREAYIDPVTGVPNERAALETSAPEDKPLTANANIEGIKYANDTGGHEAGDALYRTAARALQQAGATNLARRGGDFTFHVADEAELQEVLRKANEANEAKGLPITGAAGETWEAASAAHEKARDEAVATGTRANPRAPVLDEAGQPVLEKGKQKLAPERPKGLAEGPLQLPENPPAFAEVPEAIQKGLARMGPRELAQHAYVDPETGVLNAAGWAATPRKAHVAVIDIKSFKEFNKDFGWEAGNDAIAELSIIARKIGGASFDFAHLHGDEYALQHDDPEVLRTHLEKLVKVAHDVGVDIEREGKEKNVPLEIRYGRGPIGERSPLEHAEADLIRGKGTEEPGGGARPRMASEATLGEGARSQGFGGAEEARLLDDLDKGRAAVARMRGDNRDAGNAWLDYIEGKGPRPTEVPDPIKKRLAKEFGLWPANEPYPYDAETGRTHERVQRGRKVRGVEPEALRRIRLMNQAGAAGAALPRSSFDQPGVTISNIEGQPVTLQQGKKVEASPQFKSWFGESQVVDETGAPQVVYHGARRSDRIKDRFRKDRATSGPMAFFTDEPEIASGYAGNKADTSLEPPSDYADWFKVKVGRTEVPLDRAWWHISPEKRAEIAAKAPTLTTDDASGEIISEKDNRTGTGGYDQHIKEARGNHFRALVEEWLNSGNLFDREDEFMKVLEKVGARSLVRFDDPHAEHPGVFPVYLSIKNPLDTGAIPEELVKDLERAAGRQRKGPEPGADFWDKRSRSPQDWIQALHDDAEGGTTHAWTSIPDWVTKTLQRHGYDGIKDTGGKYHDVSHNVWIPFEETQVKSATGNRGSFDPTKKSILKQGDKFEGGEDEAPFGADEAGAEPRGDITFGTDETGRANNFRIRLLEKADRSTLFHEASHFLSWSLHNISQSAIATPELKADYETLIKHAGYESVDQRLAETQEHARLSALEKENPAELTEADVARMKDIAAKEESISHAFEAYIMEGKAPNKGLARVFSNFRRWLTDIYKGFAGIQAQYERDYGQPLVLSKDVRDVFDRLLGQDQALTKAEAEAGGREDNVEAMAKMTKAELEQYRKLGRDARAQGEQAVAAEQSERSKRVEADRAKLTEEVGKEADALPIYSAAKELGIPAEQLGEQMFPGASKIIPRDEYVRQEVQKRLNDKYGPEVAALTKEAMGAAHNDADVERALLEHKVLARDVDPSVERKANAMNLKELRAEVRRMVGERLVDNGAATAAYQRAERKLALEAARLEGKGDAAGAAEARQKRILNKLLFMETRDANAQLEKARERMVNPSDAVRGMLGKADPAYRDVHDAILAAAQLGEEPPEGGKTLDDMLAAAKAGGQDLDFDVEAIRKLLSQPKDWDTSMTVDEAREVANAVANIREAARNQVAMRKVHEGEERAAFKQKLIERLLTLQKRSLGGEQADNPGAGERLLNFGQAFDASLTDTRTWAEKLDNSKEGGPWRDLMITSRLEARDHAAELTEKFLKPVQEKFKAMPKEIRNAINDHVDLPDLPPLPGFSDNRTRSSLYMLFLNWGNEGNRQRLVDGRRALAQKEGMIKTGNEWTRGAVEKALQQLKPEEADFLQTILDGIQALYKPMADVHERETGLRPQQVEATPITVGGKEYRGGYFPAKYDFRAGTKTGARQLAENVSSVQDIFPDTYQRPGISASFAKARADAVKEPIDLSWSNVNAHVSQVIHDIAYREWVKDVASVLTDKEVRQTLKERIGVGRERQLIPWLQAVASQRVESVPGFLADVQKGLGWLGSKFTTQSVGWSVSSAAGLMTDAIQPVVSGDLGGARMFWSMVKTWNPFTYGEVREAALKLSPELRYRETQGDNSLQAAVQEFGKPGGIRKKIADSAYWFHTFVDRRTATLLFDAKYQEAMAKGATQEEAVRAADDVVTKSLPSVDIAEKPAILRGKNGISGLITFYAYANKVWNYNRRAFDRMNRVLFNEDSSKLDKGVAVAKFAGQLLARGLVPGLMGALLRGHGPDEDEDKLTWAARSAAMENIDTVPLLGAPVDALLQGKKPEFKLPPHLAMAQGMMDRLWKMMHGKQDEDDDAKFWHLAETIGGLVTGVPTVQLHKTLDYWEKLESGEAQPRGPLDVIGGTLYGERKAKPANPFTAAQSLSP